jgi:hypothetical protein
MVSAKGGFWDFKSIEAVDDQQAIELARQYANGCEVELWERGRRIRRLAPDGSLT